MWVVVKAEGESNFSAELSHKVKNKQCLQKARARNIKIRLHGGHWNLTILCVF